ncbi:MAG: TetR/AcrR family transcriptional regulator [Burkholderiales bacterium]|nr:TetR/AcrR family transcriptional regulator [Burkholderiales bacterium]
MTAPKPNPANKTSKAAKAVKAVSADNPTRLALIEHGLQLAAEKGLRGLTVRELAAKSGVNLGSFVYHFGNREQFLDELVELWYGPMYERIKQASIASNEVCALQQLQSTLTQVMHLIAENVSFISHLLADALAGEAAAQRFLLKVPGRHPKLLAQLLQQAQADGDIIAAHPMHLLLFVMSGCGVPIVMAGGPLQGCDWLPPIAMPLIQLIQKPELAQVRIAWALNGICTENGRKKIVQPSSFAPFASLFAERNP